MSDNRPLLSDFISSMNEHFPDDIISQKSLSQITALCGNFPQMITKFMVFETGLNDSDKDADFIMNISRNELSLLNEVNDLEFIFGLFRSWKTAGSVMERLLDNIWLEFDLRNEKRLIPGIIFFEIVKEKVGTFLDECGIFFEKFCSVLGISPLTGKQRTNFETCIKKFRNGMSFFTAGLPVIRPAENFRICLLLKDKFAIYDYLCDIGLSERLDEIKSTLDLIVGISDFLILHLDIGENLGGKIGVEINIDDFSDISKARGKWKNIFDVLVENGLSLPDKINGLLSWFGQSREILDPNLCRFVTKRFIVESKIVFEPGKTPCMKSYPGIYHSPIAD